MIHTVAVLPQPFLGLLQHWVGTGYTIPLNGFISVANLWIHIIVVLCLLGYSNSKTSWYSFPDKIQLETLLWKSFDKRITLLLLFLWGRRFQNTFYSQLESIPSSCSTELQTLKKNFHSRYPPAPDKTRTRKCLHRHLRKSNSFGVEEQGSRGKPKVWTIPQKQVLEMLIRYSWCFATVYYSWLLSTASSASGMHTMTTIVPRRRYTAVPFLYPACIPHPTTPDWCVCETELPQAVSRILG